jgi:hypothetical protein
MGPRLAGDTILSGTLCFPRKGMACKQERKEIKRGKSIGLFASISFPAHLGSARLISNISVANFPFRWILNNPPTVSLDWCVCRMCLRPSERRGSPYRLLSLQIPRTDFYRQFCFTFLSFQDLIQRELKLRAEWVCVPQSKKVSKRLL